MDRANLIGDRVKPAKIKNLQIDKKNHQNPEAPASKQLFIYNMARLRRIVVAGAAYHVMNQINRRKHYLKNPKMKKKFIELIKIACRKYKCEIWDFCIMDNHVHLVIHPLENVLSRVCQWLFSQFARAYNAFTGGVGRVWRGRFKSRVITTQQYQFNLTGYIGYNPVRAGLAAFPGEYKYCGLYHILHNNFEIVVKPDQDMMSFIDHFMHESRNPEYKEKKCVPDPEYGFYPGKPGRKPEGTDTS